MASDAAYLDVEALRPGAHKRMARRLLQSLDVAFGLEALFNLRTKIPYDSSAENREAWQRALEHERVFERWVKVTAQKQPFGALDSVCLHMVADAISRKLWNDSCFKDHNSPPHRTSQAPILMQILRDELYTAPVQTTLGVSRDDVRNIFRATRKEQELEALPTSRQPSSEEAVFQFIASEIGVTNWQRLRGNVVLYKSLRGDIDDFEHFSEAAEYERRHNAGGQPLDSFGHDRALSAAKSFLRDCLSELAEQSPVTAQAVLAEYKLVAPDACERPKKAGKLAAEALLTLQNCIERKSESALS